MSGTDPFPRDRFAATLRRMPRYLKLAWRLGRDPLISRARRAAVVAAAGYLMSPIDAIPDVIPVLGRLDDIAVVLAALRFAMAGLDPVRRREHLDAVGLEDGDLAEDLRTVGVATAWTLRVGARTTARATRTSATIGASVARQGGRAARQGGGVVRRRGGSAAAAGLVRARSLRPRRGTTRRTPAPGSSGQGSNRSHSTQRAPSHQRCHVVPSRPAAKTSSRSAPHELAAGATPVSRSPPRDSHGCHAAPSQ